MDSNWLAKNLDKPAIGLNFHFPTDSNDHWECEILTYGKVYSKIIVTPTPEGRIATGLNPDGKTVGEENITQNPQSELGRVVKQLEEALDNQLSEWTKTRNS